MRLDFVISKNVSERCRELPGYIYVCTGSILLEVKLLYIE